MADIFDALGEEFEPDTVEGSDAFEPLPAGWYTVGIEDAELKTTKAETGKYIKMEMSVIEGEHEGRKLFSNINIVNPNEKSVEIGMRELAQIGKALGIRSITDCSQLIDGMMQVKVKVTAADEDKGYDASNDVKAYKAVGNAKSAPAEAETDDDNGAVEEEDPKPKKKAPAPEKKAPAARKRPWEK